MRIASWNINHIRQRLRLLVGWLARTHPDVVALQEFKCPTAQFPEHKLRAVGYACVFPGQCTCNGVALLARGKSRSRLSNN